MSDREPRHGWYVVEWSKERGRGSVESQVGRVEFDGAIAEVDDFVVGEPVQVELERAGDGYRVRRIWPSNLRLPGKDVDTSSTPALEKQLEEAILAEMAGKGTCFQYQVKSLVEQTLVLEGDDNRFEDDPSDVIEITGVGYVALPVFFDCQFFRLATAAERNHVGRLTEITAQSVVFTFVEDEKHFHFVEGSGLRWRR